jgi:hypothetical protein
MVDYFDHNGKKLKKGFYKENNADAIFYFTGKYNESDSPILEKDDRIIKFPIPPVYLTKRLIKIPKKEVRIIIEQSRKKANWLERKIKEEEYLKMINTSTIIPKSE